jgi:DNA-binding NarL/FixJ family response regulator
MTRVLIVDSHPLIREGIARAVQQAFPHAAILEAGSTAAALELARQCAPPNMVILEPALPGAPRLEALKAIREYFPGVPVLVFSALDDGKAAADAGALGFVPKSASLASFVEAIATVWRGGSYFPVQASPTRPSRRAFPKEIESLIGNLTPCETRVLELVRLGLLNKQIAHELGVGETTVKARVTAILRKLKVATRTQVVIATFRTPVNDSRKTIVSARGLATQTGPRQPASLTMMTGASRAFA